MTTKRTDQKKKIQQQESDSTARARHRQLLLDRLSDPEKDFPKRAQYPKLCNITAPTLYYHFSPNDLLELEAEAMELRRARSAKARSEIYDALLKSAKGFWEKDTHFSSYMGDVTATPTKKYYPPNPIAAKELLDRFEGKVVQKHSGPNGEGLIPNQIINMQILDLSIFTTQELKLLEKLGMALNDTNSS